MWSALEACIPAFCSEWLLAHPEFLSTEALTKIRIPANLLGTTERKEAMDVVVGEIARQLDAPLKPGVGRFQGILEKIGLSFGLDDELRKTLFEMSKVRNLLVHQYGKADQRFVDECPWLALKPGDQLLLKLDDYQRYRKAIGEYCAQIVLAARSRLGQPA